MPIDNASIQRNAAKEIAARRQERAMASAAAPSSSADASAAVDPTNPFQVLKKVRFVSFACTLT